MDEFVLARGGRGAPRSVARRIGVRRSFAHGPTIPQGDERMKMRRVGKSAVGRIADSSNLLQGALCMDAKQIHDNPSPDELRKFTEQMTTARVTEFDNVNVQTRVTSRSTSSTFIVTDDPELTDAKTMSRADYDRLAKLQDDYIADQEMVVVDGYIGNVEGFQTAARLSIEKANANIAGMQQKLYYERDGGEPDVHVIYTPNLVATGYPEDRCIAVDLDNMVTRVIGSDYFGESKKGGLRMWNKIVYDRGGLSLHAGLKSVPVGSEEKVFLIIGLSGTGKT
ncbi:MAG TPA: hypothetical protein DIT48_07655, partial [Actinobacteria bacterium]|nr:hypothetical protein [Actinomycetota bacterium]